MAWEQTGNNADFWIPGLKGNISVPSYSWLQRSLRSTASIYFGDLSVLWVQDYAICTFTAYVPRPIYVHAMHSLISNLQMRKQRNQLFLPRQTQQGNIEKTFIWKKTKNATDFQELLHTSIWKAALATLPSFLFYPPKFCNKTTLQIQFLKLPNKTPITC